MQPTHDKIKDKKREKQFNENSYIETLEKCNNAKELLVDLLTDTRTDLYKTIRSHILYKNDYNEFNYRTYFISHSFFSEQSRNVINKYMTNCLLHPNNKFTQEKLDNHKIILTSDPPLSIYPCGSWNYVGKNLFEIKY